jgi:hypothetical protein
MAPKFQVTFDCADPNREATFWAAALGYQLQPPPEGFESWQDFLIAHGIPKDLWDSKSAIIDPDGGPRFFFQRVPEPKTAKNRVHLDVNVSARGSSLDNRKKQVDTEVERLLGLGATHSRTFEEMGEYWVVMTDPEGNEFCVQ